MATTTTPANSTDKVWDACGRCGGDGVVHYGNATFAGYVKGQRTNSDRICFWCNGTGGRWITQATIKRRKRDRARREAKRQQEAEARAAEAAAQAEREADELAARMVAYTTAHPDRVKALRGLAGEFGDSLRKQFEAFGELTQGQADALDRITDEAANDPDPAPVVTGRIEITGRVVSEKWQDNDYGSTHKMLVLDDRGFKVWGSVPRDLESTSYYDSEGAYQFVPGVERGGRVQFTATVEASDRDETFGFFKRPTKAQHLDR